MKVPTHVKFKPLTEEKQPINKGPQKMRKSISKIQSHPPLISAAAVLLGYSAARCSL
jgi:hypothetical protein